MELWLVRNGESTWNQARRFQGARDAELSLRRHEQAQALAERLTGAGVAAIFNTSVTRVELPDGRLTSLNDTGHLDVRLSSAPGAREAEAPRTADAGRP